MKPHQHGQCLNSGMDKMSTLVKDLHSILKDIAKGLVSISCHPLRKGTGFVWAIRGPPKRNFIVLLHYENKISEEENNINETVSIKQELDNENYVEFQTKHVADPSPLSSFGDTSCENVHLVDTYGTRVENNVDDLIDSQHYEFEEDQEIIVPERRLSPNFVRNSNYEETHYVEGINQGTFHTNEAEEAPASLTLNEACVNFYCKITSNEDTLHEHDESNSKILSNQEVNENESHTTLTDIPNTSTIVKEENEPFVESEKQIVFDKKEMKNKNCSGVLEPIDMSSLNNSCVNDTNVQRKQQVTGKSQENHFLCSVCSRTFIGLDCFNIHVQEKHSVCKVEENDTEQNKQDDDRFQSFNNEKRFDTELNCNSELMQHSVFDNEERPHQCLTCGKIFATRDCLEDHLNVHTGLRPYQCLECGKTFAQQDKLNKHRQIHDEGESYQCPMCEKKFCYKGSLKQHMNTHTGTKPFQCSLCGKNFTQKCSLQRHEQIHTGVKPYQCSLCYKDFYQKEELVQHIRLHNGSRPYQCSLCGKSYVRMSALNVHKRIHAREEL